MSTFETRAAQHRPVHAVPIFYGTQPEVFQCSKVKEGCRFEVAITPELPYEAAEAKFIAEHTDKQPGEAAE
ncbi:MAG TPA: hypothetical protein VLJ40_11120 [Arthrobacter sp.]|nr:hypothetical protein [Arthrobacter sp.]